MTTTKVLQRDKTPQSTNKTTQSGEIWKCNAQKKKVDPMFEKHLEILEKKRHINHLC